MILLDGKEVSSKIKESLKIEVAELNAKGIVPNLGVILVGEFPPSVIYVRNKEHACKEVGIKTTTIHLKENVAESELMRIIEEWNANPKISGILVQMPLPPHINHHRILNTILPTKDVDGLCNLNLGNLISGREPYFYPCTPLGIIELLYYYQITPRGRHCVIVGRGELVGKPLANMLLLKNIFQYEGNATVTVCHSQTPNLSYYTSLADILIVAIGKPEFVKKEMVKDNAVVVDVGVNRISVNKNNKNITKLVGDCDFEALKEKVYAITPVPGGVGPMTVAMLLKNTVRASKINAGL
ncbi:MAG: bifunctional 5,10-methylene-tetrahydrofolate dehydrogenase/5,10-methylene-tetrahydrofolate cyclohydrolase [candidate division WOR-3 bacterium]|nr:bifunctional 5,10-methylene-tetrahydrofolate dehydrogenase/5,10-methylene-tetrahydrofolate cyclohydrolase [candidate division WOR-3 bacterium]MDW7987868.1 tetrahydrofolate dehydrogenase/cyclohydrolase catalytic domain-containing protein [candidate division WOR-3 bacterium]